MQKQEFFSKSLSPASTIDQVLDGVTEAALNAWDRKEQSAAELGASALMGSAMAFLSRGRGIVLPALIDVLGAAMTVAFVKDLTQSRSPKEFGKFIFDTAFLSAGGLIGNVSSVQAGGRLFNRPWSRQLEPNIVGNKLTGTSRSYYHDGRIDVKENWGSST